LPLTGPFSPPSPAAHFYPGRLDASLQLEYDQAGRQPPTQTSCRARRNPKRTPGTFNYLKFFPVSPPNQLP